MTDKNTGMEIFYVEISDLTSEEVNLSLDELVNKTAEGFEKKEYLTINNASAIQLTFGKYIEGHAQGVDTNSGSSLADNDIVVFLKNNQQLILFWIRYEDEKTIFDQIFSTFKFIKSIDTTDTTNWKAYRNEEYGFEVGYPESLTFQVNDLKGFREELLFWATFDSKERFEYLNQHPDDPSFGSGFFNLFISNDKFNTESYLATKEIESIKFNNVLWYKVVQHVAFTKIVAYHIEGDLVFQIAPNISMTETVSEAENQELNQILSTFKFVK
jgi:hypothetical protein